MGLTDFSQNGRKMSQEYHKGGGYGQEDRRLPPANVGKFKFRGGVCLCMAVLLPLVRGQSSLRRDGDGHRAALPCLYLANSLKR